MDERTLATEHIMGTAVVVEVGAVSYTHLTLPTIPTLV